MYVCIFILAIGFNWGHLRLQCMRAGFLCPKCNNFACLHIRQDQNKLQLKR